MPPLTADGGAVPASVILSKALGRSQRRRRGCWEKSALAASGCAGWSKRIPVPAALRCCILKTDQHFGRAVRPLLVDTAAVTMSAQAGNGMQPTKTFTVEYYYTVKWGHQEEFLTLFRKNHLPVLRKQIESGRILSIAIATPRYHMMERDRWDYRVTLVFKDAVRSMEGDSAELIRQLYPDQAAFKREEERRFEILEAHWDLPITEVELDKQP